MSTAVNSEHESEAILCSGHKLTKLAEKRQEKKEKEELCVGRCDDSQFNPINK